MKNILEPVVLLSAQKVAVSMLTTMSRMDIKRTAQLTGCSPISTKSRNSRLMRNCQIARVRILSSIRQRRQWAALTMNRYKQIPESGELPRLDSLYRLDISPKVPARGKAGRTAPSARRRERVRTTSSRASSILPASDRNFRDVRDWKR